MAKKDWKEIADVIKAKMAEREPNIKVADLTSWLDLSSTSVGYFYLVKLEELGFVRRVENGEKSEWFLNYTKKGQG